MHSKRRWIAGVSTLLLAALAVGGFALTHQSARADAHVRPFDHVFVIMMENHGFASVIGDPNAPYINQLAAENAQATNYYGVTHPSLPNYVAATSGNNWYSNSDDPTQVFDHSNIVDQLEGAQKSWKGYMESIPAAGSTIAGTPDGLYAIKHDPFMLYSDVRNDPARASKVVPLTQLDADLADNTVPNFVWISPNQCNDMHGVGGAGSPCPYGNAKDDANDAHLKQLGDAFVKKYVEAITHSKAWTGNSVIFLTWDENDYTGNSADGGWDNPAGCCDSPVVPANSTVLPAGGVYGGGTVPMIVIGTKVKQHFTTDVAYNHYSMLKTIEDGWHLDHLGMTSDDAQVKAMEDVFQFDR